MNRQVLTRVHNFLEIASKDAAKFDPKKAARLAAELNKVLKRTNTYVHEERKLDPFGNTENVKPVPSQLSQPAVDLVPEVTE